MIEVYKLGNNKLGYNWELREGNLCISYTTLRLTKGIPNEIADIQLHIYEKNLKEGIVGILESYTLDEIEKSTWRVCQ